MAVSDQVTRLGNEIATQEDLIEQISAVLNGKAGGSVKKTVTVTVLTQESTVYYFDADGVKQTISPDSQYHTVEALNGTLMFRNISMYDCDCEKVVHASNGETTLIVLEDGGNVVIYPSTTGGGSGGSDI